MWRAPPLSFEEMRCICHAAVVRLTRLNLA